jgi:hypothetical protein
MSFELDDLRALQSPLIAYVGPELPRAAGLPARSELVELLLAELPADTPARRRRELSELASRDDPTDAFTELEREHTAPRFTAVIDRALQAASSEPPALVQVLASFGPRLQGIVTPNLDRLIERAFAGRLVTHVRPTMALVHQHGWLLKTHGSQEDRSSWVFTRAQQARVLHGDPVYAEVFRALFIGKSLLFLDASFEDPILASVVERIRSLSQLSPPRHWALVRRAELSPALRNKLGEAGIAAIPYASEHERLEILGSLAPDGAPALPTPPIVRAPPPTGTIRVLFVGFNPEVTDALALGREQRAIRGAIERARHRERIALEVRTAATFTDLCRALLEDDFDIVHLAGHGEPDGLLLEDERAELRRVELDDLAELFGEYAHPRRRLRCVLFNTCWSADAGRPTSAVVPTTIAMNGSLDDRAAVWFAEGFYDAIGAGRDFAEAFREGQRRARVLAGQGFDAVLLER